MSKMKYLALLLLIICSFSAAAQETPEYYDSIARRDSLAHLKHRHPLPLECSRIIVSESIDSSVVSLYGQGLYDAEDGHVGARYYTDPLKQVILKSVIGTDSYIEEVGLTLFNNPFNFVKDRLNEIPVAENLSANPFLIKGVNLGDTPKKVIKAFGIPNQNVMEHDIRALLYEDDYTRWDEVLYYEAYFEFKDNRLVRIIIYDGD